MTVLSGRLMPLLRLSGKELLILVDAQLVSSLLRFLFRSSYPGQLIIRSQS
jgi:hypothetical protein